MLSKDVQVTEILGEVDRHVGLDQARAELLNEFFYPRSPHDYLLFLWLEADRLELHGRDLCQLLLTEDEQQRAELTRTALTSYSRATRYREAIWKLLALVPAMTTVPGWVDTLPRNGTEDEHIVLDGLDRPSLASLGEQEAWLGDRATRRSQLAIAPARSLQCMDARDEALAHYRRAAVAYRVLIGGWFHEYASTIPRIVLEEADLDELRKWKRQLQQVEAKIAKLEPKTHDRYVDAVGAFFPLGVGGSGRNTAKLNRRKERAMDRTIAATKKLLPLYQERDVILYRMAHIMNGARKREREQENQRAVRALQAHLRVQQAEPGDIAIDVEMGRVQVVKRGTASLTVLSPAGRKIPRRFRFFLDVEPRHQQMSSPPLPEQ